MKTINQHAASGPNITIEDIIFEGRNHSYGAFMLRKKYNKGVLEAFFLTVLLITPLFFINLLRNKPEKIDRKDIPVITIPSENFFKEAIKPPMPPEMSKDLLKQLKVNTAAVPVVVDTVPPNEDHGMAADPTPAYSQGTVGTYVYTDTSTTTVTDGVDLNKPYLKVEEDAIFKGGTINDFCKWVAQQIKYPDDARELELKGKVFVRFVVNREGKTEDISILKGVDPLLDREAIRVVASSPRWRPARQQGTDVKQQFVIPIFFQLK